MARPTSFRLPEELLERLEQEAAASGTSTTSLVASLLSEGITTRRFAGVVYRNGPTGRRAALVGGPDVWERVGFAREGLRQDLLLEHHGNEYLSVPGHSWLGQGQERPEGKG